MMAMSCPSKSKVIGLLCAGLWATLCMSCLALAQDLPQQMGAINDYAAALGGKPQREPLEALINQLNQEGVSLVLLLSERDPFSDLEQYGTQIQRAWKLAQTNQVFALFLKDDRRWHVRLWISPDLTASLGEQALDRLRQEVETLTQRGHIQQAAQSTAQGLFDLLQQANTPLAEPAEGSPWVFVVMIL